MHTFWPALWNKVILLSIGFFFHCLSLCFHTPTCASHCILFCIVLCSFVSCSCSDFSYSSGFLTAGLVAEKHTCLSQLFWVSYITGLHFWPQGWIWRDAVLKSVLPLCLLLDHSLLPHSWITDEVLCSRPSAPLLWPFHVHFIAFVLNVFKDENNTFWCLSYSHVYGTI